MHSSKWHERVQQQLIKRLLVGQILQLVTDEIAAEKVRAGGLTFDPVTLRLRTPLVHSEGGAHGGGELADVVACSITCRRRRRRNRHARVNPKLTATAPNDAHVSGPEAVERDADTYTTPSYSRELYGCTSAVCCTAGNDCALDGRTHCLPVRL